MIYTVVILKTLFPFMVFGFVSETILNFDSMTIDQILDVDFQNY